MKRLRYSEAARADVRAIYRQGVESFGIERADVYAQGLRQAIDRLAQYPNSAPVRSAFGPAIRVLPYRSHVILYATDERGVHILRIRHGAEDWTANPTGDHR